jgi:uncharacterized protein GlcG (DUF336 family)
MAQDVLTAHRPSAALAAEGRELRQARYKVTAAIVDDDGVVQAMLRGDGAFHDYTEVRTRQGLYRADARQLAQRGPSPAIVQRIGTTPSAGGLAKLPHILLLPGAIRIKVGSEAIAAANSTKPARRPVSTRSAAAEVNAEWVERSDLVMAGLVPVIYAFENGLRRRCPRHRRAKRRFSANCYPRA